MRIEGEVSYNLPAGTSQPEWAHQAWWITLRYNGREMTTPYFGGGAASEPTIPEVAETIANDCASVDNARDFWDWCDEFGMEPSRESQATYDACLAQRDAFRELLGSDYDLALAGAIEGGES